MYIGKGNELSRRAFMRRSGQLAGAGVASSYALGLAGIGEAAAFSSAGGYKALVCVFLYGGNDHGNTLIPYDATNYGRYAEIRGGQGSNGGGIALPRSSLASTVLNTPNDQTLTDDIQYALAPTMPRLKARFDQGAMAPLLNVGPLITPLTKAQFESGNNSTYPRPPKLFSHNDQQSTWQSSQPEGSTSGWGGRMGDLAQSGNTNSMFTLMNASGNAVFMTGETATPYKISSNGATLFRGLDRGRVYRSQSASSALDSLLRASNGNVLEADYSMINARSIEYGGFINDALENTTVTTDFGSGNRLADQLSVVARLIAARNQLGVTRQVFMVGMGGFDHHDGLIGSHEELLGQVDFALDAFYQATLDLGIADQVTTFTASDFGRTFASNGDGSDHGWGSHHFIVGGGVNGGRFYGTAPQVSVESDDQVGRGRLLPTVSVDEYSSTLAQWFGVDSSELPSVAPNIGRFAQPDLGFMQTT
ncbi:MAG: DUF1501 domain-containing protein [Pseudomonadota bacterium]